MIRAALILIVASTLSGCDSCPKGGEPLTGELAGRYGWFQECMGMEAPPPLVVHAAMIPCPTSGRLCCLEEDGYYACPSHPDKQCGSAGKLGMCNGQAKIILPNGCDLAFEHESLHWLLHYNDGNSDPDHERDEWKRVDSCRMDNA